jgi:hypothetical protein
MLRIASLACGLILWAAVSAAAPPVVGTGLSLLAEPRAAGAEAGRLAAQQLGAVAPKLVVVFASRALLTPDLVDGVASVFERALISGCEGYAPLTAAGNAAEQGHTSTHATAVLVIGGDLGVQVAAERTDGEGDYGGCGRRLGAALKPHLVAAPGHVLLTFGDQHVGRENRDLVAGLQEALGARARIAGAAAGGPDAKVIVAGQIVTRSNVAVLLTGDVHVRVATRGGEGDLVGKARDAFQLAFRAGDPRPVLGFVFDCGGRRGQLLGERQLAAEHQAMLELAGGVPLFGFYGGGEIGAADDESPAQGVGFNVSVAALYPGPAPVVPAVPAAEGERQGLEPAFAPLPFGGWRTVEGTWAQTAAGAFRQSALVPNCRAFSAPTELRDVVYEVTARKTTGAEGFMLIFRAASDDDLLWWNVGGWNNTRHALERKGRDAAILHSVPGSIETGRDYVLRVAAVGPRLRCWLDGKLIHDINVPAPAPGLVGLATWNTAVEYRDAKLAEVAEPGDRSGAFYRPAADFSVALEGSVRALREADGQGPSMALLSALRRDHPEALAGFLRAVGGAAAFAGWLERGDDSLSAVAAGLAGGLGADPAVAADQRLRTASAGAADARWPAVVLALAAAARRQALSGCPPIAFVARNGYGMSGTNATLFAHRTGVGSEVLVWDPREPDTPPRRIFGTETGFVWDLCPSWDGRRLLMSLKTEVWEPFHIWEIGVDGSGLRQLTEGPWHDFNPVFLPGNRIAFSSSRVESYSLCQDFLACALYSAAADGSDLRRIDFTTLCTNAAAVLPDGALIATRWEYQDKNIFSWQGLWTVWPDGGHLNLYFGNTLTVPNSLYGPRPIPGTTDQVVITMAAHHYPPIGDIAIVDRRLGVEEPRGCRKITAATPYQVTAGRDFRDCNWGPGDVFHPYAYVDPWPVSADLILVSYGGGDDGEKRFRLCALTGAGARAELLGLPERDLFSPVSLAPRPVPHVLPLASADDTGKGTFYVKDIGRGLREQGVKDGQVTRLRVMEVLPKPYNTEGPRYRDHYPVIGYGSYYVKRILGEVPVRADGSLYFRAPAGIELYFIALDAQGREVQRMGSVTQLIPGAQVSCIGCHENRLSAPPATVRPTLLSGPPDEIEPPAWGDGGAVAVDFVRSVQPVLDRHCASCHSGPSPQGGIDLSGDKTRMFNMAFTNLTLRGSVDYTYINRGPTGVLPALQTGSMVSRLTTLLEAGHGKTAVPAAERRILYAWIDANAPYYGTWEMSRPHSQGGRDTWTRAPGTTPLPWFAQVLGIMKARGIKAPGIEDYGGGGAGHLDETKINLTHPEWSALLLENLAASAGGRAEDGKAVFQSSADPDYATLLAALREGARLLAATPRVDMPGAKPIPQKRDFGQVFGAPRPATTAAAP